MMNPLLVLRTLALAALGVGSYAHAGSLLSAPSSMPSGTVAPATQPVMPAPRPATPSIQHAAPEQADMRITGEAAAPELVLKKMQAAQDSANQAMRTRLAQPYADSASTNMKRSDFIQGGAVHMNAGKRIMGGPAASEPLLQSAGSARIDTGLLAAQCGTPDAPQPPHLGKLILPDWQPILWYMDSPGFTHMGPNGYYGQQGDLSPGSLFGLSGRCFGDAPGSVIVQFGGAGRTGGHIATRVTASNTYEAVIESWSNSRISARIPGTISGVPPGNLTISVRTTNGELLSQPQTAHFWPKWEFAGAATKYAHLLKCHENLPIGQSSCRAGSQLYAPLSDFVAEFNTFNSFKAQHQIADPGDARQQTQFNPKDTFRLEMPSWVVPYAIRIKSGARSRDINYVATFIPPSGQPSRPLTYDFEVQSWLRGKGDWIAYEIDAYCMTPADMSPPGEQIADTTQLHPTLYKKRLKPTP
jgi:hypothetical protein